MAKLEKEEVGKMFYTMVDMLLHLLGKGHLVLERVPTPFVWFGIWQSPLANGSFASSSPPA